MVKNLDRNKVKGYLDRFDLQSLFINELGWDHGGNNWGENIGDNFYFLEAIANKRGMVTYQFTADTVSDFPDFSTRQKIERKLSKSCREHIIVFATEDKDRHYWQWVKREPNQPDRTRTHHYSRNTQGEALIQKLENLAFTLDEEEDISIVDVTSRVRAAFDVENVTKKFYERFKREHTTFLKFIKGIENLEHKEWYASLMLNRMMFIYFIQKRGFLDSDKNYLSNRLNRMKVEHGKDSFHTFYRLFLLRLFHEGLSQPVIDRSPEITNLLGRIPYLNGGLFEVHDLERENKDIQIPDSAFEKIFKFFEAYDWHLDNRPLRNENEINPDVIGYIFEKYINQKQMGAYYTQEDITGFICNNTILPFLLDKVEIQSSEISRILSEDPDRYIHPPLRHGISYDIFKKRHFDEKIQLPEEIAAGLKDISKRKGWNNYAPKKYALPSETWRMYLARKKQYEEIYTEIVKGEILSTNDLITFNLDIEQYIQDLIRSSENPEFIYNLWINLRNLTILDPTCGSGAFLFAALNILEPIYNNCLTSIRGFLDDQENGFNKFSSEIICEFQKIIDEVEDHSSESYFILKSIVINNLYGVDIMQEAVEICKLRLFLKLVAQLDNFEQIEPLPDIDFNIRSGNSLVGFTSITEVKVTLSRDLVSQLSIPEIINQAKMAEKAYQEFSLLQTKKNLDSKFIAGKKRNLKELLEGLRFKLDRYLAINDYGIDSNKDNEFSTWQVDYKPFHWFVEFFGIMQSGGFDLIIGNPPYINRKKVAYELLVPEDENFSDIYGNILIKTLSLICRNGRCGMIVPLSLAFSKNFQKLRNKLIGWGSNWFSSYDNLSPLFKGVDQRCTIWIGNKSKPEVFVAPMFRWHSSYRQFLFSNLIHTQITNFKLDLITFGLPKLNGVHQNNLIHALMAPKINQCRTLLSQRFCEGSEFGFSQTTRNYISVFLEDPPSLNQGSYSKIKTSQIGRIELVCNKAVYAALASTAGELYFWYWLVRGDGFHVTKGILVDYLSILNFLPPIHYCFLIKLGRILDAERNRWLRFNLNAGKYIGSYDFRGAFKITRRADLLILDALSGNKNDALEVFDFIQRMRPTNLSSLQDAVPKEVRTKFTIDQQNKKENEFVYSCIDSHLKEGLNFSEEELSFIINRELVY